jgi:hypothetical protein
MRTAVSCKFDVIPCVYCMDVPFRQLTPPKLLDSILFQNLVDTAVRQTLGTVRWGLLTFETLKFDQSTGVGVVRVAER